MQVRTTRLPIEEAKIIYQETAGLAIITIHRPQAKNALTANMWAQLAAIAKQSILNPNNKVLIIRGYGHNFTAGSDIKEFNAISLEEAEHAFIHMENTISTVEQLPIPVIAVIDGPAMGAGLELALACDLRIGSENARLGIPVGKLGITLNQKFTKRLVDLVGPAKTKDFVFTGRIYNSEEALHSGLLNYVVEAAQITRYSLELGQLIASMSPDSLKAVKQSVHACLTEPPTDWALTPFVSPNDFTEGVRAFSEKRLPQFTRSI